jgi:aryl-alcohol dehydrogenase-like predicted oxidoreductase
MPEALAFQNQMVDGKYMTTLDAAEALGISVVASGSLMQGQMARGLPEAIRDLLGSLATDAQTGIQFVRSAPGVTTALIGMSRVSHVEENLKLLEVEPAAAESLMSLFEGE